jgi:tetratricopeptide (TPR) repeat protein
MSSDTLNPIAQAALLLEQGELAAAEKAVTGPAVRDNDPDALHLLGLVRIRQDRMGEAMLLLNRSLAVRPGHPHVQLNLAKALIAMGRDEEAAEALEAAIAAAPDLAEAWYDLGELKLRAGDNGGAESDLRKALQLAPAHPLARLWLGVAIKNAGRGAEAEPILVQGLALAAEPQLKAAYAYNLAWAQYIQGKKKEALENFTLAGALDPGGLNTELNRADLLEEAQRFDEALALLEETLRRQPGHAAAHTAYNNLLFKLGRDTDFLTSFDRAPKNAQNLTAKAGLLYKTSRIEEACALYAAALAEEPGNLEAAIGAAAALNHLKRSGEAMKPLERALKYHPRNGVLYQTMATTALQAGDPQKAAAMAEQSLRLLPVDQSGLAVLGTAWRMMGDARDEMLNGYDELIGVFDLEPPDGFSSMADFNHELNAWLDRMHPRTREPLEQSLRHGSQTRGYMFGQGHDLVERLGRRIGEAVLRYIAQTRPDARHPFRGRAVGGFRFKDSWSSRLRDCGFHVNHIHPGGWISSCYYVSVPDAVKDETAKQGWIKFGEPSFEVGLGMRRAIQPVAGRLVLFPSYMWHGTIPFRSDAARTTIAFDAVPPNSR